MADRALTNLKLFLDRLRECRRPLEEIAFPLVLIVFAFAGAGQGVDVSDTTYSLSNYRYSGTLDPMWLLATWIPNLTGRLMLALPGAGRLWGFNLYATVMILIPVLSCYYLLRRFLPPWMIFVGEWIAVSLCWCPRAILYNYMSYLFFTLGVLVFVRTLATPDGTGAGLFAAGVLLGLNVMVRFPNLTEAALILVLFYDCAVERRGTAETLRRTTRCMLGYACGLLVPFLIIGLLYGFRAYGEMIASLFGMTESASEYTLAGMLGLILDAYRTSVLRMGWALVFAGIGTLLFLIRKEEFFLQKIAATVVLLLVLVRLCFARGIFTRNYWYYDSVFSAGMFFVILTIVLAGLDLAGVLNGKREECLLSAAALVVICVTPLGSNNYTYPLLNNLFFVAPVALGLLRRAMRRAGDGELHIPWKMTAVTLCLVLLVQGTLFRTQFAFGDGDDGTKRTVRISAEEIPKLAGMKTREENATALHALGSFLREHGLEGARTLAFGKIPGVHYIFDLAPATETTWPDLDSYTVEKFDAALERLETPPLIILRDDTAGETAAERKLTLLRYYMDAHHYTQVYTDGQYTVYSAPE